jgi:hypothetical protein
MKNRKHVSYEGFPEKAISYHSLDYAGAMNSGGDSDAYQGAKPTDKIAVAREMSKHHGVGLTTPARQKQFKEFQEKGQESKKKGFIARHPVGTAVGAAGLYGAHRVAKAAMPTLYGKPMAAATYPIRHPLKTIGKLTGDIKYKKGKGLHIAPGGPERAAKGAIKGIKKVASGIGSYTKTMAKRVPKSLRLIGRKMLRRGR